MDKKENSTDEEKSSEQARPANPYVGSQGVQVTSSVDMLTPPSPKYCDSKNIIKYIIPKAADYVIRNFEKILAKEKEISENEEEKIHLLNYLGQMKKV